MGCMRAQCIVFSTYGRGWWRHDCVSMWRLAEGRAFVFRDTANITADVHMRVEVK